MKGTYVTHLMTPPPAPHLLPFSVSPQLPTSHIHKVYSQQLSADTIALD